jgi:hypothetical protein
MPVNSLGILATVVSVRAAATFTFSRQDTTAALSAIPSPGGTTVRLPSDSQSGDRFEFADVDGSCSPGSPIVLAASPNSTVAGGASVVFVEPFQAAATVFDEASKSWAVVSKSSSAPVPNLNLVDNGIASPVELTPTMQDLVTIGPLNFLQNATVFFIATVNASGETVDASGKLSAQITIDGGVPQRGGNRAVVDVVPPPDEKPNAQITLMFQFGVAAGSHTFKLQASSTVDELVAGGGVPGCEMSIFVLGPIA